MVVFTSGASRIVVGARVIGTAVVVAVGVAVVVVGTAVILVLTSGGGKVAYVASASRGVPGL